MMVQFDLPESLNRKIEVFKAKEGLRNKGEAIIRLLELGDWDD